MKLKWYMAFLSILIVGFMSLTPIQAEENAVSIEIVLDGSGSMVQLLDGQPKMAIAREVILKLIQQIAAKSSDTQVGLRVYGHQYHKNQHNCQDTKLEIPLGAIAPDVFKKTLDRITPQGYTLIAYSLQQAMKDFPAGVSKHIILVTDGEETCQGNVQAVAKELQAAGIVVHVVGYKITGAEKATITPLYTLTGGQYYDASNQEGLQVVLAELAAAATGKTGLAATDPDLLYRTALAQFQSKNYLGAKKLLEKAVTLKPGDDQLHDLLGRTYQALNNPVEAAKEFELAIKYAPDNSAYQQRLKQVQEELRYKKIYDDAYDRARAGDFQGAIAQMQEIPAGKPWYDQGQVKIQEWTNMIARGKEEAAKAIFDQCVILAKSGKLPEAIAQCKTVPAGTQAYTDCQTQSAIWGKMLTEKEAKSVYDEAYTLAKAGSYQEAIEKMKTVASSCTCYEEAQQKIAQWGTIVREAGHKVLYEDALNLAKAEKYEEALKKCWLIPQGSSYYARAQAKIKEWGTVAKGEYTNSLGMKFVLLKPGTFMMGSPSNEPGRWDSEIQHQVTLTKAFYMQTTELTQSQWQAVMGNNPSQFKGSNLPVEQVSWDDTQDFIRRLNSRGQGNYRLPTEAEWEYAARAGSTTAFANGGITQPTGNDPVLNLIGWYDANSGNTTHPVAQKQANAWGLYDMHGNVWEWVQDWYGDYGGNATNPQGPSGGSYRVFRGGSWCYDALVCRSAYRYYNGPSYRYFILGLRLLRSAP